MKKDTKKKKENINKYQELYKHFRGSMGTMVSFF